MKLTSDVSAKPVNFQNMEIEGKNGSKIRLQEGSETFDFGRGLGFISNDRAISRHHISFNLHEDQTRVCFEVKGKNPVWVRESGNDKIRVYKRSEGGEIKSGDSFCVASKNPVWFNVKGIAREDQDDGESKSELSLDEAFAETSGIEYDEVETGDISNIDPVKEFNFVVIGHEFDNYPKKMLRDIRNWDWFLEEPKEDSDEDEVSERKKKGTRKKRKKSGGDDDDEVWTGESEEDVEMIKKMRNVPKPKYSTRSKEQKKDKKGASTSKNAMDTAKKNAKDDYNDDDEDEDEADETLGGFIVDDEDIGEENDEDDEEEEFEDDEDEDE
ncbi:hypothetical protein L1887_19845 [Cichorium endivia]|nr:hypothetical protein L1887_19845 [Cichorium endivia]